MALPQIGSFALLLALGLAAYSFVVGAFALIQGGPGSDHLSETARRAGIAVFGTVLLASVVLVTAAFTDNFSVAYIYHHSNRDLPGPYKFAVLWSGQEGSLLFWSLILASYAFVLRLRYKTDPKLFAYASVVIAAVQVFFLLLLNIAAHPFAILARTDPARRQRPEPLAPVSGDGDSSAHAVSGIRRIHDSFRVRAGRADHAAIRARSGSTSRAAGRW